MFFRRGVSDDEWLEVKLWLFSIGALLALLGMLYRNDWLIGAAALVLAAGVLLRFIDRKRIRGGEGHERSDEEEGATSEPPQHRP